MSLPALMAHYAGEIVKRERLFAIRALYDPPLAYLRLILDRVGDGLPLGSLRPGDLVVFGATLDATFFPGLPLLFDDLWSEVAAYRDLTIEFYIVSGGLEAVIAGRSIVGDHFAGFYGCQLGADGDTGGIRYVKRCITFTEKTRYLFEINKGVRPADSRNQPHLVNQRAPDERRIPFENMIYVGDGLTNVPCPFTLTVHEAQVPSSPTRVGTPVGLTAQRLLW